MKIAFVIPYFMVSGGVTYVIRKSKWLANHGHKVLLISSGEAPREALHDNVSHVSIDNLFMSPLYLSFKSVEKILNALSELLVKENIDVVEVHESAALIYVFMSYSKHKVPFLENVLLETPFDNNINLRIVTRIMSKNGLYFTLTTQMNEYISLKCRKKLTPHILPIPVACQFNNTNNTDNGFILTICRLVQEKMYLKYLIRDFVCLHKENRIPKNIVLKIVGDGPMMSEIRTLVQTENEKLKHDAIVLMGTIVGKELDNLYASCSLYVGVGTTLILAGAHSKPALIASGLCQQYTYGFWGEHFEEDKNILGGDESLAYRKTSFRDSIEHFFLTRVSERNKYGEKGYQLFNSYFEAGQVMPCWVEEYAKINNKVVKGTNMLSHAIRALSIFTYPIYVCYKKIYKKII